MTTRFKISPDEWYPVLCVAPAQEGDDPDEKYIDLSAEEQADLKRVWDEFQAWQKKIAAAAGVLGFSSMLELIESPEV